MNTYQDYLYAELQATVAKNKNCKLTPLNKTKDGKSILNSRKTCENFARKNKRLFKSLSRINRFYTCLPKSIKH